MDAINRDEFNREIGKLHEKCNALAVDLGAVHPKLDNIATDVSRIATASEIQNGRIRTLEQARALAAGGLRSIMWSVATGIAVLGLGVTTFWITFRVMDLRVITGG